MADLRQEIRSHSALRPAVRHSVYDEEDRALGSFEHRGRRVTEGQRGSWPRTDAHDHEFVLTRLELAQNGIFCSDLGADRRPHRHTELIAEADCLL